MKKFDKQYSPNQPKANLQRGAFSQVTQKYNQYSKKQIDQLLFDLQRSHDSSFLEQKSYEIPLNIQKIKKYSDESEEQPPNKSLNSKLNQNDEISFKSYQGYTNNNSLEVKGLNKTSIQFQNNSFNQKVSNNRSGISMQASQTELNQQTTQRNQNISFHQLMEVRLQFENLYKSTQDKSQIICDLVEQIKQEHFNLKELQQDYSNFKFKNDVAVVGIEKQIQVQQKNQYLMLHQRKLKVLNLRIQQKEESEIEEMELRQKINEEFQHLKEQIQFLEAENQLEIESFQEEIQKEKQIQAQMIKQLEKINNKIEESQKNSKNQEDQQQLLQSKQFELKELEDRKLKVIADIQEVQKSYNRLDQQYQLAVEIIQNESYIEKSEFDVTLSEQNILIQQLIKEIKILSELITNQNSSFVEEDFSLKSTNHSSPKMKESDTKDEINSFQQFSQVSQNKIAQALQQQMKSIDEDIQKSQTFYEDQLKKKEALAKEIEQLLNECQQKQDNYKQDIQQLQITLQNDKTELKNNQSELIQKENEIKEFDSQIDANLEIINSYQSNIKNTKVQMEQLQLKIHDLTEQIKQLQEQSSKITQKKNKI